MIVASTGSALYSDLDTSTFNGNVHEDERALQIALELSNLGLLGINDDDPANYDDVTKGKKSQNMTECVPVPSSEHVAEIVGRQGTHLLLEIKFYLMHFKLLLQLYVLIYLNLIFILTLLVYCLKVPNSFFKINVIIFFKYF